jgi:hypothetical protein
MKTKPVLTIITLIIISTMATLVSAQTVNAGVNQGDIFEYNYAATWNSTNPSASPSSSIVELTQIKSFQIKITSVSGATVNAEVTKKYQNDTTKTVTGFVDVQSGSIHLDFGTLIIAANRTVNDPINPSWTNAIINETITRTYPTGNRETNKRLFEETSEYGYEKTEVYYDKIKGIAVDSYFESRDTYGGQTEIFTETITNTNSDVWTIPELSTLLVPLTLFVGTTTLLVAKKAAKKRHNR